MKVFESIEEFLDSRPEFYAHYVFNYCVEYRLKERVDSYHFLFITVYKNGKYKISISPVRNEYDQNLEGFLNCIKDRFPELYRAFIFNLDLFECKMTKY